MESARVGSRGGHEREGWGGSAAASSAVERLVRKLARKLRRKSKAFMEPARAASLASRRQYDPQSYARNFDRDGLGNAPDDHSAHFGRHTFSARFAANSTAAAAVVVSQRSSSISLYEPFD